MYNTINKILLLWLLLVLVYPIYAVQSKTVYKCKYYEMYGKECISCGLTRGFSACFKGNFSKAQSLNSLTTFLFFTVIGQIIFRFIIAFKKTNKALIYIDIAITLTVVFTTIILIT
ncbi:DUF2752 domain-containing protein [Maribellus maritimus]|uniref:DUF2752 domain-containing protein n=1 Tax=Maribellus maritimus TaxID=2870838 RepID=UPI00374D9E6F